LKARVSLSQIKELGIALGDEIYLCFAAEALNVFTENYN